MYDNSRWVARGVAVLVFAAAATAIGACSNATGVASPAPMQLGFTTRSSAASAALASAVPITQNGHTLDLTLVSVTVDRADLKRAHTDACRGDDEDDDDRDGSANGATSAANTDRGSDDHKTNAGSCAAVKVGPATVDLPLTGSVVTPPGDAIPAGTYREIEFRVSFVRLKGTFDTKPFDVTLATKIKSEIEFATPVEVTEGAPTSITVNIPVDTWLVNADGTLIDPSKIATSPTLMALVKSHIVSSLRAFEDNDHDGHEDHGGRGRD